MLEVEALILLLLRRAARKTGKIKDPAERAEALRAAAETAIFTSWRRAFRSGFSATLGQLGTLGYDLSRGSRRAWDTLEPLAEASAARAAYGLANRSLSTSLGQGGKLGLNLELTAATEAATAYGRTRQTVVSQLPRRIREQIYVRRETAGDRRVCEKCLAVDGMIAPAEVGVSPQIPVHGKCRCSETIISREEADWLIEAGLSQEQED